MDTDLRIRVRAHAIRQKLKRNHNNCGFRDILDALTDAELIAQADEHHAESLRLESAKKAEQPLTLLFRRAIQHVEEQAIPEKSEFTSFETVGDRGLALLYKQALACVGASPTAEEKSVFEIGD